MTKKQNIIAATISIVLIGCILLSLSLIASKRNAAEEAEQTKRDNINTVNVGDYIFFGTYEQDGNTENGKEEIQWLVLDEKDGKLLVVSAFALDCKSYHTINESVTWETCSLNRWLKEDFLGTAFTPEEESRVQQVFVLSDTEAKEYFNSDEERMCKPTAYAVSCGAISTDGNCWWWLRSAGDALNVARCIKFDGSIYEGGIDVTSSNPVRPAMWIDLNQ